MPQKHDTGGSGPQWKIAESDGREFHAGFARGFKRIDSNPTDDMEIAKGNADFGEIIRGGKFFADKSLLIRDIEMIGSKAYLFTRPRRSGKSLALSMIDRFYNVRHVKEEAERDSFEGLKITECSGYQYYRENIRNRYPVVRLDLSELFFDDLESFKKELYRNVRGSVKGFLGYLDSSDRLDRIQKLDIAEILDGEETNPGAIVKNVCGLLEAHHGVKPIILIDEYDNPLATSYGKPYFGDLARMYGAFLGIVVKTNGHTSFTVMTGIQRVITGGMVSVLNNLDHYGVLSPEFADCFGITYDEAKDAVRQQVNDLFPDWSEERRTEYADRKFAEAVEWYDGYRIGGYEIFNPWSITQFISRNIKNDLEPVSYWNETSEQKILNDVLGDSGEDTLEEIKRIYVTEEGKVFKQLDGCSVLWSKGHPLNSDEVVPFLLSTGYLTAEPVEGGFRVTIPNNEVRKNFDEFAKHVLDTTSPNAVKLVEHIVDKKAGLVKDDLEHLMSGKSYLEGWAEPKVRSWLSTVFALSGYRTVNEHASGNGRSDILIRDHKRNPPILLELKVLQPDDDTDLKAALDEGFDQIIRQGYADQYQLPGVIALAVAVKKKSCEVRFLQS